LIGQWPHARPPDPKTYSAGIAATLANYPLGIVQECCDPRKGLARTREFPPTVAAIIEWCDTRRAYHNAVASYQGRAKPVEVVETPMSPEQKKSFGEMLRETLAKMRMKSKPIEPTPKSHLVMPDPVLNITASPSLEEVVRAKGWVK